MLKVKCLDWEKASKLQARIQEKKLLKAEKKRFKHNKENFENVQKKTIISRQATIKQSL